MKKRMSNPWVLGLKTLNSKVKAVAEAALEASGCLLRLGSCWLPRSVLQPGLRLKWPPVTGPKHIGFHDQPGNYVFITTGAGVSFENTSNTEALVILRCFGPEMNLQAPNIGDSLTA